MKDVLENLSKLPPFCYAVMNDTAVQIRRGAREASVLPNLPKNEVDFTNRKLGVTPQQVQAMLVGVTLGWDMDGADPDTHAAPLGRPEDVGPFSYTYTGELCIAVRVTAHTEEAAAALATESLRDVADWFEENNLSNEVVSSSLNDTLDLSETDDPR